MIPPDGPNQNKQSLAQHEFDDRDARQSVLVQKGGKMENIVIVQKEVETTTRQHDQKPKDFQHNSNSSLLTTFKHDNLDMKAVEENSRNKRGIKYVNNVHEYRIFVSEL